VKYVRVWLSRKRGMIDESRTIANNTKNTSISVVYSCCGPLVWYIIIYTYMATFARRNQGATGSRQRARRQQALRAEGATHPHPEAVTDPLFRDSAFFDPNDLVQVKYEMLRSVQQEERSVVEAAQASGLSRPAFYVTQELFQREGLPGLLPRKRGPKRPHKLSDEAMAVLAQEIQEAGRMLKGEELAALLSRRFGVEAHPRSILRRLLPYLRREEKKLR
jgi:transposase